MNFIQGIQKVGLVFQNDVDLVVVHIKVLKDVVSVIKKVHLDKRKDYCMFLDHVQVVSFIYVKEIYKKILVFVEEVLEVVAVFLIYVILLQEIINVKEKIV